MAEIDQALAPPSPPPIPFAKVRARFEREMRRLAEMGLSAAEARPRAIAIVRAAIRNSEALAVPQWQKLRCLICNEPEALGRPFVDVLTGVPGQVNWMHRGACHDEHIRRQVAKADAVMAGANISETK